MTFAMFYTAFVSPKKDDAEERPIWHGNTRDSTMASPKGRRSSMRASLKAAQFVGKLKHKNKERQVRWIFLSSGRRVVELVVSCGSQLILIDACPSMPSCL